MQDNELLELLRQKDPAGLEALLLHYGPFLRYIISPILPDPRDQEECLSDISMRVWEKCGSFLEGRGTLKSWLAAVARNAALNRARTHRPAEELSPDLPAPGEAPEEKVLKQERLDALARAMSSLTPGEKALIYRKYYFMQPIAQIARELGMTQRAVEGRLYRLKQRLRKALGGDGIDGP